MHKPPILRRLCMQTNRMRQAAAIICFMASCSTRIGVTTGLLVKDVKLDVALVKTELILPGNGGKAIVERQALRTKWVLKNVCFSPMGIFWSMTCAVPRVASRRNVTEHQQYLIFLHVNLENKDVPGICVGAERKRSYTRLTIRDPQWPGCSCTQPRTGPTPRRVERLDRRR